MNKRKIIKTTFIILLFTIAVIGGSNQAAQALYYNIPTSNEEIQEVETDPTGEVGIQQTSDTIDVWIEQEYEIAIYDLANLECHVISYWAIDIDVIIEVWIQYSNGSNFRIYTETTILHPFLEYVFNVEHSFTLLGYHLAVLNVMDLTHDLEAITECEWYVYDGYVELVIIQDYEAQVGIEVSMDIYVFNGYAIAKDFYIEVRIDNGTHNIQIFEIMKTIEAYNTYITTIYWTFTWADYYDVELHVLDLMADVDWYDYCYFYVYDGFVDIVIEQNYEAWIGVEERIQIWVANYYLIDITANIEVWIDNGTQEGSRITSTPLAIVEMAGVEPASREFEQGHTTSLVDLLTLARVTAGQQAALRASRCRARRLPTFDPAYRCLRDRTPGLLSPANLSPGGGRGQT